MKKATTSKKSKEKISTQAMLAGLSENEVKVLMFLKDQNIHRNPPKGMDANVFSVVCEMLKERKYVKEVKEDICVSWGESPGYHIMPKGYEIVTILEQESKKKEEEALQQVVDAEKKLEAVITDDELNMLFAEVVKKHLYFRNSVWSTIFWNVTKSYLKRLFCQGQNPMTVYSIAGELSAKNTNRRTWQGPGYVDDGDKIAYKLYVVIYYKFKANPSYSIMLDALAPQMDMLGSNGRLEEINKTLDTVRDKYGTEQKFGTVAQENAINQKAGGKMERKDLRQNLNDVETLQEHNHKSPSNIKIAKGRNTDFIKVMYALWDCGVFVKENGDKSDIKDVMEYFGGILDSNTIKNYSSSLSEAKEKKHATFLKIIADMEKVLTDYFNKS